MGTSAISKLLAKRLLGKTDEPVDEGHVKHRKDHLARILKLGGD